MNTFKLFLIVALFTFSTEIVKAQSVDVKNKVEYAEEASDLEDLNSITTAIKVVKKTKVSKVRKLVGSDISIEDLQKMARKKSNLRYRKQRKNTQKCFKDVEDSCESSDEK